MVGLCPLSIQDFLSPTLDLEQCHAAGVRRQLLSLRPVSKLKEKSRAAELKMLLIGGTRGIASRFLGYVCMQQKEGAYAQVCSLCL